MNLRYASILVLIVVLVTAVVAACTLATASAPSEPAPTPPGEAAAATPTPSPTPRPANTPAPPTPTPTATPLPDRNDCDEMRGTQYRSTTEREWYLANCIPTPTPVPPVPPPNPPAIPGPELVGERWILIDIASQTTSAMIGDEVLYTALVTTGKDGWETPTGTFKIIYRVENETMTSESIGAEEEYELKDVLYTQYFTNEGHALHLNYWREEYYFGNIRSSHGCIGMRLADAEFFWNFARYHTRVTIQ